MAARPSFTLVTLPASGVMGAPVGGVGTLRQVNVRRIPVLLAVGALAISLAACGGSSKNNSSSQQPGGNNATGTTVHVAKVASNAPSESAMMICDEAVPEIAQNLGVKTVKPPKSTATWTNHIYACDYVYPNGTMRLAVKEMSSPDETTAYYDQLAATLGKKTDLQGLGQGAFVTKDGSVVVRKDYKVMEVDSSKLPAQFGVPPDTRENDAINVAAVVMGCWTGA